ncbi:hypothetical protein CMO88_03045 [Candidatus Woesearchaeota archaeon]|nr:hypothetical protein [Candidatus Woesearchaeota archaeon]
MYEDRGGFESRDAVPVNVGDEFEVTIEAVGAKGDGIAKKEGFVLFVPGVQKGDNVKIKITKVLRKVGFAEVVGSSEGGSEEQPAEEAPADEASEEAPQEEATQDAAPEEAPQDSEDFGEDEKK